MNIKDQIRAEIERLYYNEAEKDESILAADAYKNALDAIEKFLATLPEQPASDFCKENCKGYRETGKCFADGPCVAKQPVEGLEEEIRHYCKVYYNFNYPEQIGTGSSIMPHIIEAARHFAEWQKAKMLEGAVEGKVFMSFAPGHNQMVMADVDLPTNTKVKVIIVKEDE